jgi:hypothetical protein
MYDFVYLSVRRSVRDSHWSRDYRDGTGIRIFYENPGFYTRLRGFAGSRFRANTRSRLRGFESSGLQTTAHSRLRDLVRSRLQIFASSLPLKTCITNLINLDVSRVTGFPELPNKNYFWYMADECCSLIGSGYLLIKSKTVYVAF